MTNHQPRASTPTSAPQTLQITRRMFVVGCPRSGTTLVQSMLGGHPQILAFAETQFFRFLYSPRWSLRLLRLASLESLLRARRVAAEHFRPDLRPGLLRMRSPDCLARHFLHMLDTLALDARRTMWSEKSPTHVFHIPLIERFLPDATFVHVIRDGLETVASLRHAAITYPESDWPRVSPNIRAAFELWRTSVEASATCAQSPRHVMVRYEYLVQHPHAAAQTLCTALQIPYDDAMLDQREQSAAAVTRDAEQWKSAAAASIQSQPSRLDSALSPQEKDTVRDWVAQVRLPICITPS